LRLSSTSSAAISSTQDGLTAKENGRSDLLKECGKPASIQHEIAKWRIALSRGK
jgi:hypothetical protein